MRRVSVGTGGAEPGGEPAEEATQRLRRHAERWGVRIDRTVGTTTALVGFGVRGSDDVVLKVARARGDEWDAGRVLAAFAGAGMVRAATHVPGAVLMERLLPGTALTDVVRDGGDDQATDALIDVIEHMAAAPPAAARVPTAQRWGAALDGPAAADPRLPPDLLNDARTVYRELCRTQRSTRLLHGDLQHTNVLLDARRGWVAIDPKGVIAETEFELGAALRNPPDMPELYATRAIERRVARFAAGLGTDPERTVQWCFAQAVLSAVWTIQDGLTLDDDAPALCVAAAARALL